MNHNYWNKMINIGHKHVRNKTLEGWADENHEKDGSCKMVLYIDL